MENTSSAQIRKNIMIYSCVPPLAFKIDYRIIDL